MRERVVLGLALLIIGASACSGAAEGMLSPRSADSMSSLTVPPKHEDRQWVEVEHNGVLIGIDKPPGWEVEIMDGAILMAEAFEPVASGGSGMAGIQLHIFLHPAGDLWPAGLRSTNLAYAVLSQITHTPRYIGAAHVAPPQAFVWDQHDAAYYLSNNADGNVMMVIALALPNSRRLLVSNLTAPAAEAGRIRAMLPLLLGRLTINGAPLDAAALNALPNPLVFPPGKTPSG